MDPPVADRLETFVSITGASRVVAAQKLQANQWDLSRAIDAFFNEGEAIPQIENQDVNMEDYTEDDETVGLLHPRRSMNVTPTFGSPFFPVQGPTPIISEPRVIRNVPIDWRDEQVLPRPNSGIFIEEVPATGAEHIVSESHGHITVDDDEPDVPSISTASTLRNSSDLMARSGFGNNPYTSLNAPIVNEVPSAPTSDYDDTEEAMLQAALAASKEEAEAAKARGQFDNSRIANYNPVRARPESTIYGDGVSQQEAKEKNRFQYGGEHSTIPRHGSSSGTSNTAAIGRGGLGKSYMDSNIDQPQSSLIGAPDEAEDLEDQPLVRRRSNRHISTNANLPAPSPEQSMDPTLPVNPSAPAELNDEGFPSEEWGGISAEEHEEAVMLEAAMFGSAIPEDAVNRFRYPSPSNAYGSNEVRYGSYPRPNFQPASPTVLAQRRIREQQDDEYLASLEADREKEAKAHQDAEARRLKEVEAIELARLEEQRRLEEERHKIYEEEELKRILEAKRANLPSEPAEGDDESTVTISVRMPDGSRQSRRFHKSDKLQSLFDFIDVGGVKPGSYRLVRQYPRKAFTDADHEISFTDLGLASKLEAFFLELI